MMCDDTAMSGRFSAPRRCGSGALGLMLLALSSGCFQERAFPIRPGDLVGIRVSDARTVEAMRTGSTREWLRRAHAQLAPLLPDDKPDALLTDAMAASPGRARDVYAYFDEDADRQHQVLVNFTGLLNTAQAVSSGDSVDSPDAVWDGFTQVWIPVAPGVELSGWLGLVEGDGGPARADCIVLVGGLFGDNKTLRTRDLCKALVAAGFHALALEMRGHGQTEARFPDFPFTFGMVEAVDLLKVSEWLTVKPPVRNTGLAAFCWGGNIALLSAWIDGGGPENPDISKTVSQHWESFSPDPHYQAGIMVLSSVIAWEPFVKRLERPTSMLANPPVAFNQDTVRTRMKRKGYTPVTCSLRKLIEHEIARSRYGAAFPSADGDAFLRLVPYENHTPPAKMASVRVPTLIVHGVDDPFASAQAVADLAVSTDNPHLGALILPGGGHVGFAPYARAYYFSLVLNFFDPVCGAAAASHAPMPAAIGTPRESSMRAALAE